MVPEMFVASLPSDGIPLCTWLTSHEPQAGLAQTKPVQTKAFGHDAMTMSGLHM